MAAKKAEIVEVVLAGPHTHLGVEYGKGDTIKITKAQAKWLKAQGVVD